MLEVRRELITKSQMPTGFDTAHVVNIATENVQSDLQRIFVAVNDSVVVFDLRGSQVGLFFLLALI